MAFSKVLAAIRWLKNFFGRELSDIYNVWEEWGLKAQKGIQVCRH